MSVTITATKNRRTLVSASTTLVAGTPQSVIWGDGTTGVSGCALTTSPDVCTAVGKVTNGSTGPTLGATLLVEVSGDGSTNWESLPPGVITFPTTNSGVYSFAIDLPRATRFARFTFGGNTAQNVTIELFGEEVTNYVTSP